MSSLRPEASPGQPAQVCPACEFAGALEVSPSGRAIQPDRPQIPVRMGDYELGEEIARGGMGVVCKARQVSLNRAVAVKMILACRLAGPRSLSSASWTEPESAAKLHHPNIVAIHEICEQEGRDFLSNGLRGRPRACRRL